MPELVYYVAVSLDGYIAGPDGAADAFLTEGDHMAAQLERFGDAVPTDLAAALGIDQSGGSFGTVLMGTHTYAIGYDLGVLSPYRHLRQIVFSHRYEHAAENLHCTDADPVDTVRRLKESESADLWLCGGGNLATQLIGEIDRLVLKRQPFLFGAGIPLFRPRAYAPVAFEHVGTESFSSGVSMEEYVVRRSPAETP